jgi:hypothetical protein
VLADWGFWWMPSSWLADGFFLLILLTGFVKSCVSSSSFSFFYLFAFLALGLEPGLIPLSVYSSVYSSTWAPSTQAPLFFFFFFCNTGVWTQGLCLESLHSTSSFILWWVVLRLDLGNYFPRLALNLVLLSSWDYRCESPGLQVWVSLAPLLIGTLSLVGTLPSWPHLKPNYLP